MIFLSDKQKSGLVLCNNIKELSLVMFYSNNCPHCKDMLKILRVLPKK